MEGLLDRAPCGFLTFDRDGIVRDANATFLDLVGHDRDAVVGQRLDTLLSVASRVLYQTHFFPLLRMQGFVREIALTGAPSLRWAIASGGGAAMIALL